MSSIAPSYDHLVVRSINLYRVLVFVFHDLYYFEDRVRHIQQIGQNQDDPVLPPLRSKIEQIEGRLLTRYQELQNLKSHIMCAKKHLQETGAYPIKMSHTRVMISLLRSRLIDASIFYGHMDDDTLYHYYMIWCKSHPRPGRAYLTAFLHAHPDIFHSK
jgi:hypothetical protein